MLDAVNEPDVQRIVFMTSGGVGKTSVLDAIIGYFCDQDPAPVLIVLPTLAEAEGYSKERLSAMITETPALTRLFERRSRDSGSTLLHKDFPGGYLALAGANSAASLQRRHVRIVLCDEVDSYPADADGEGDPVDLAFQRMARFEFNRIGMLFGTPTLKGVSRLERAYEQSDQRRFFVPCARCTEFQTIDWETVRWRNHDPETAHLLCSSCSHEMGDAERLEAVRRGEWRAGAACRGTIGFHIWEGYATSRLSGLVAEWYEKKNDRRSLQTFWNKKLGRLWDVQPGEGLEWSALRARAEDYPIATEEDFVLPDGVLLLTASVDTQNDRLEAQILGFGRDQECWVLGYLVLEGDPIEDRVWAELDRDVLQRQFTHPRGGQLEVSSMAVDTGGQRTQAAYSYCRARSPRVMAIKGSNLPGRPVLAGRPTSQDVSFRGAMVKAGVKLWPLGVDTAKAELYARFAIERLTNVDETTGEELYLPTPRYVHFSRALPDAYFEGVVSEKNVPRYHRGVARMEWVLPPGKRNEPLDTFVYAYAAALRIGLQRTNWDALEAAVGDSPAKPKVARVEKPKPAPGQAAPRGPWISPRRDWLR